MTGYLEFTSIFINFNRVIDVQFKNNSILKGINAVVLLITFFFIRILYLNYLSFMLAYPILYQ